MHFEVPYSVDCLRRKRKSADQAFQTFVGRLNIGLDQLSHPEKPPLDVLVVYFELIEIMRMIKGHSVLFGGLYLIFQLRKLSLQCVRLPVSRYVLNDVVNLCFEVALVFEDTRGRPLERLQLGPDLLIDLADYGRKNRSR